MQNDIFEYPSNKPFLEFARNHQRMWMQNSIGVESIDKKRVILPPKKAYAGCNFYNEQVCSIVKKRFPKAFQPGRNGFPKPLIANALRSEHIPFNLFSPLSRYINQKHIASFFSEILETEITQIEDILIEYAEPMAISKLGDNTKFDAYVKARNKNGQMVICIEVKYTEGSYPWGKTEKRRMFADSDQYIKFTKSSPEFKPNAYMKFRNIHLKQIWRNYLLGIVSSNLLECDYIYIHLYPESNHYQSVACEKFAQNLTNRGKTTFKPTTYEEFVRAAKNNLPDYLSAWIDYIETRYIVPKI